MDGKKVNQTFEEDEGQMSDSSQGTDYTSSVPQDIRQGNQDLDDDMDVVDTGSSELSETEKDNRQADEESGDLNQTR